MFDFYINCQQQQQNLNNPKWSEVTRLSFPRSCFVVFNYGYYVWWQTTVWSHLCLSVSVCLSVSLCVMSRLCSWPAETRDLKSFWYNLMVDWELGANFWFVDVFNFVQEQLFACFIFQLHCTWTTVCLFCIPASLYLNNCLLVLYSSFIVLE